MEFARSVIAFLRQGEHMASMDIQEAYLLVPIYPSHQLFLHFAVTDDYFKFVTLPFSLSSAPRLFTNAPLPALIVAQDIR